MERKIGEIFEYNGEWFQCVECDSCGKCSLRTTECESGTKSDLADEVFGECSKIRRLDSKHAIFKKLKKVGEPVTEKGKTFQKLISNDSSCKGCVFCNENNGCDKCCYMDEPCLGNEIWVEIKQNKEVMEYKIEEKKLNLKPFDIQKAREGKPVCTRDRCKARIICFDSTLKNYPLVVLIEGDTGEYPYVYTAEGKFNEDWRERTDDLMMLPEKKEGWVNVYKGSVCISVYPRIYKSREEAVSDNTIVNRIDTVKITWEE